MRRTFVITAAVLAALTLTACSTSKTAQAEESEEYCRSVKPGTVTSVNYYCAVVQDDPVDPEVVHEYKGQRVGFCCPGCIRQWNKMTEAEKDQALATAIAKGKPQG